MLIALWEFQGYNLLMWIRLCSVEIFCVVMQNTGQYLHSAIQPFIHLADLLSQLLQIVGLIHDVRIYLTTTHQI